MAFALGTVWPPSKDWPLGVSAGHLNGPQGLPQWLLGAALCLTLPSLSCFLHRPGLANGSSGTAGASWPCGPLASVTLLKQSRAPRPSTTVTCMTPPNFSGPMAKSRALLTPDAPPKTACPRVARFLKTVDSHTFSF